MLEKRKRFNDSHRSVSVAGCLGYDVLANADPFSTTWEVSVAGCLGYDVLVVLEV